MRPIRISLLAIALAAAPAHAQIYRWVDTRGIVNYSNVQPAPAAGAVRIDLQPGNEAPGGSPARPVELPPAARVPAARGFPGGADARTVAALAAALERRAGYFVERGNGCPAGSMHAMGSPNAEAASRADDAADRAANACSRPDR
ncbi:MAG: DUF4124 domain-containing protein [Burkholderiales bacterium]|nr:DUF4124 domain-containing protein [Burkholderiales bacterium]